ncbi:MAG: Cna B-type domain-containing protein, partial [Firmicutes bacterium]|nr:Cna B-type domain-containing protein [Bacillota bacterium]
ANGVAVDGKTVTLNADNKWKGEFKNLPVNEAGQAVKYTIAEVSVPEGYKSVITGDATKGFTVTNTHKIATVNVPVTKVWNDKNMVDGYENPYTSVKVYLYANDVLVEGKTLTLDASTQWKGEFKNLPANEAGKAIKYTVKEETLAGYTVAYSTNAAGGLVVTNTPDVELVKKDVDLEVLKLDKATQAPLAGAEFTIAKAGATKATDLAATGEDGKTSYKITEAGTYTVTETKAPVDYDLNDENTYNIVVEEKTKVEFNPTTGKFVETHTLVFAKNQIENFSNGVLTVKNPRTIKLLGTLIVNKNWNDDNNADGLRAYYQITLYANGEVADIDDAVVTLKADELGYRWSDLPKNDEYGNDIIYTVKETVVPTGYTSSTDNGAIGFDEETREATITNTHKPKTMDIPVTKIWNDEDASKIDGYESPESVTVQLLIDGQPVEGKTLVLSASNEWKATFTGLHVNKDGKAINYSVAEKTVAGYKAAVSGATAQGFIVQNTPEIEVEKHDLDFTVLKIDRATKAPLAGAEFTIEKEGSTEVTKLATTGEDGKTSYTFKEAGTYIVTETKAPEGYDLNDENSYEIVVAEKVEMLFDAKLGKFKEIHTLYFDESQAQSIVDGVFTVSDPRIIILETLTVHKVWDDENNADKLRADYEVTLYANGEVYDVVTLKANELEHRWNDLPENDEYGNEIVYTVVETFVPEGYTSSTDKEPESFNDLHEATITNTHVPDKKPNTGDDQNMLLYSGMLMASLMGLIFARRKREN